MAIEKINHISQEELEIEIITNDISYSAIVNLKSPAVENIPIKIQNEFPFKHNKSIYTIHMEFNYQKFDDAEEENLYEPVNKLLYRIPSYEYEGEKEISSTFFYEILEGNEFDLLKTLSSVYWNMILFADKLAGKNNAGELNNAERTEQFIRLNKILIIHNQ